MGKNVLIVDDSPIIHNILRRTLEKLGYVAIGDAKNGKEAIDMYKELNPDIVFMDITMPVMDGIEAARNIRQINPDAKIIMLSAMGDDEIISQAKEIGVFEFLKKPFDEALVRSVLSTIV